MSCHELREIEWAWGDSQNILEECRIDLPVHAAFQRKSPMKIPENIVVGEMDRTSLNCICTETSDNCCF